MSTTDAIAGVTNTLLRLLQGVTEISGSALPTASTPDKVTDGLQEGQSRVNIFLYQTMVNAGWNNMNPPPYTKAGELAPPLALNLYYLLTVYADNDPELSQRLLGKAMSLLHDNARLTEEMLKDPGLDSGLERQIDRIHITPQPLSLDEMSKLWTTFQTQYRTSAAYQVSVVLIDSQKIPRTPLPVLQRGPQDQGVLSQPDLIPPLPTLTSIEVPDIQPSLRLDEPLILHGYNLNSDASDTVTVRFSYPERDPVDVLVAPNQAGTEIMLTLLTAVPDAPTVFSPGIYRVTVLVPEKRDPDKTIPRTTNTLSFPLAPRVSDLSVGPDPTDPNRLLLTLTSTPQARLDQDVVALVGSHEVGVEPRNDVADPLIFNVTDRDKIPADEYVVRLRVDGVDSFPIIRDEQTRLLKFDDTQKVTIDG
jgi:hypothetical protein